MRRRNNRKTKPMTPQQIMLMNAHRRAAERELDKRMEWGVSNDTVALEVARGGQVETTSTGQVRMKTRDGLRSATEVKHGLTRAQYETGLLYRAGWEARSGDIGSQLGNEGGGGGHNNDLYVFNRRLRAEKLVKWGRMERAVAVQCSAEPACLQMLRWVAGEGHSLSAYGDGRAFERNLAALKRALDIAGSVN